MAQTIQIRRGTGSAVPSSLAEGELAINTDTGKFYYGNGSAVSSDFRVDSITAENYVVSSSVTSYTFQALSGSTDFGDDSADIHKRTGSLNVSGALNVVGNIAGNSIIADYAGGTISVGKGGTGQTTLASDSVLTGNGTSGITAESNLTYDGTNLKLTDSGLSAPDIIIESTANHSSAGNLIFQKLRADDTPADGGSIGTIHFQGEDTSNNTQIYGTISGIHKETQAGNEGGKIQLKVATHDGELQTGLVIEDGDAEDEIDVTIGNTVTSVTTIAGTLTMGSTAFVNNSGVIQVATQGTIDHDSLANFVANEHIDHSGVSITAGAGLTGGGTIAATRDIAIGAGTGVTVNANDVAIGQDVATTANVLFNNITASGHISSSGYVYGDRIYAGPLVLGISPSADTLQIGFDQTINFLEYGKSATISHLFKGTITASGHISSSGTITADKVVSDNIQAGWHGSTTRIKILVSDFIPDDIGRPAMIDDTGSDRWLESHGSGKLFASIPIPTGFKATHVRIYGSGTSVFDIHEMDIDSKTVTNKGSGNIGTELDFTDVTSNATNYLLLEVQQASGEEVYGGYVTIEAV